MAIDTTADTAPPAQRRWWTSLYLQVLAAIALGILVGAVWPETGAALKPLGDAFVKLVKMIIAPVIFCTVVTGVGSVAGLGKLGRVGAKALAYFLVVSTFALIVGLIVANLVRPGDGFHVDPATLDPGAVADYTGRAGEQSVTGFLLDIIPETFFSAFTGGAILQVLFVSLLFGVALAMAGERGAGVLAMVRQLSTIVFGVVHILMKAAPVGAFGAMAFTIGRYGLGSLVNLAALVGTFYLTSALFMAVVLGAIARASGFSLWRLLRYIRGELMLVLGTSSSESALPALIEKLERAGASRPVVGLVVPTGYSFNLDGTNIYMTLAALFIAQATDTPLSFADQILLLAVAMLSSKGAAGVTGSGFVTLAATLSVVPSVPVAGLALILGVDRFMSECRSLTNFIGNAVATLVVAKWEGELDQSMLAEALNPSSPVTAVKVS